MSLLIPTTSITRSLSLSFSEQGDGGKFVDGETPLPFNCDGWNNFDAVDAAGQQEAKPAATAAQQAL